MKNYSFYLVLIFSLLIFLTGNTLAQYAPPHQLEINYSRTPTDFKLVPKKPGLYNADDWKTTIDTTWGEGLSTTEKLRIFDEFWNDVDERCVSFLNSNLDWNAVKDKYRPEIETGVSRGRFAAIMNYVVMTLNDAHAWIYDSGVYTVPLMPGVPLLVYRHNGDWSENTHFGAGLTPLPDSSLLVYSVVENHPLGLSPGDIIIGYDGIPWKKLYKKLLSYELPITSVTAGPPGGQGTSIESIEHLWLISAGMNWHLFDTIDIVKNGPVDTVHLSTSVLKNQDLKIYCTEQLPIPGIEQPSVEAGNYVTWGIIEETTIGYVCIWSWRTSYTPNPVEQVNDALNSFIDNPNVTGIIIDQRTSQGGNAIPKEALGRLFNHDSNVLISAERDGPTDHFVMKKTSGGFWQEVLKFNADQYIYDHPVAVLSGPGSLSMGDIMPLILSCHPMARTFGKNSNSAFAGIKQINMNYANDWVATFPEIALHWLDSPASFLNHIGVDVDEPIWLHPDDVVKGEDTVVKRAIEWIKNLSYAHDVKTDLTFTHPQTDTITITAKVENPNSHDVYVTAFISMDGDSLVDSLKLYPDAASNDSICKVKFLPIEENIYYITTKTVDKDAATQRILPNVARFTTTGPVVFGSCSVVPFAGAAKRLKLFLKNESNTKTVTEITVKWSTPDTNSVSDVGLGSIETTDIPAGQTVELEQNIYIKLNGSPDTTLFYIDICSDGYAFWQDSFFIDLSPNYIGEDDPNIPTVFALEQNYPNPFNPITVIGYQLAVSSSVELSIYNILGQKVATLVNKKQTPGSYKVEWNSTNFASGVYFYGIKTETFSQNRKMLLLR